MMKLHRTLLIAAGLASAALFSGNAIADCKDDVSVKGHGTAVGSGVTKHFNFEAKQRSSITLAAKGEAHVEQIDPTGVFGDFNIKGSVVCVRVLANHAVIGLVIRKGTGTAAGHEGEAFYLFVNDNEAMNAPDMFDNSGYTGITTTDCNIDGAPGQVVTKGDIRIDDDD
jgi:hypothetical protein